MDRVNHEPSADRSQTGNATSPLIVVEKAELRYGDLHVFEDIDLEIAPNEVVSIVGASGCGKTSLLRAIAGLTPLTSGQVRVNDQVVTKPSPGVAMVFQHFGLFPWKTVQKNVAYGLKLRGVPKDEIGDRVAAALKMVRLDGFESSYPYELSGGMQQRAGLARALVQEPSVILLDEPFSAIDAQTRDIMQFELMALWESRPTAMVFVTHSIEEATLMGDRVVVLKGRPSHVNEVIEVGLPHPRTRETLAEPRFIEVRQHVWDLIMSDAIAASQAH